MDVFPQIVNRKSQKGVTPSGFLFVPASHTRVHTRACIMITPSGFPRKS